MDGARVRGVRTASWLDPLVLTVVAIGVYAVHGFQGRLGTDLGTFVYGGEHFAHGVPPYEGIFNSVGPLADMLSGIAIWLGHLVGLDPILSARLGFTGIAALCVAAMHVLAVQVFEMRAAGWIAATTLLASGEFLQLASSGPREKTAMVLLLICGLLMIVRRHWFAAGAFIALATLTWQPALLPGLAAAGVAIALLSDQRLRTALWIISGGVVPSAITVVYFWAHHALRLAFQGFVVINVGYTRQSSLLHQSYPLFPAFRRDYGPSLWLIPIGLLALLALAVFAVTTRGEARPDSAAPLVVTWRGPILITAIAALVAAIWTGSVVNGSPDLFVLLPFASLGLAGACCTVVRLLAPRACRATLAALAAVAVVGALVFALTSRSDVLSMQRRDAHQVVTAAGPRATVLSVHAPEVLTVLGATNMSKYQLFTHTMTSYLDKHLPGGMTGYADRIESAHPTLIAVGRRANTTWLQPLLYGSYERVGDGPGWTWYAARSLGDRIDQVRRANERVMER